MNRILYIAGHNGMFSFNLQSREIRLVFEDKSEYFMGLEKFDDTILLAGGSKLYALAEAGGDITLLKRTKSFRTSLLGRLTPAFHQMSLVNEGLYVSAVFNNEVWKFDANLNLRKRIKIAPPDPDRHFRYKENYNHINHVFPYDGKYYVCLNWLSEKQYGPSGVCVLDKTFNEIERFEYGWEMHAFSILDGKYYSIVGSSAKIKSINHPGLAGLYVDKELVYSHDPRSYFCKDFSMDDKNIYIVGSEIRERNDRWNAGGVLIILDRNYRLIDEIVFQNTGGFNGCMLDQHDATKTYINGFC